MPTERRQLKTKDVGSPETQPGDSAPSQSEADAWSSFDERIEAMKPEGEEPPPPQAQFDSEVIKVFDDRWRENFEGLTYLGHLEDEFEFAGHHFVVRTLTTGETLECGLITKPFDGSISYLKAVRAAWAAAGIVTVDGQPIPVAMKTSSFIRQKFEWMVQNWHDAVIDAIYDRVSFLDAQVIQILQGLGALTDEEPDLGVTTVADQA